MLRVLKVNDITVDSSPLIDFDVTLTEYVVPDDNPDKVYEVTCPRL